MPARHAPRERRLAAVTGGTRGIGLAIAEALASEGYDVAIAGRHSSELEKAAARLARQAVKVLAEPCDVRDPDSVAQFFHTLKQHFKSIDVLVNNAGIAGALANIDKLAVETWRDIIETNLTGMFLCTRAALPLMRRGGTIINNLSVAAKGTFPGQAAYVAGKHGAMGFTLTLREEVRERGIRVIALLPGATDTRLWDQFWPEAPHAKMMSPETVARAVVAALSLPQNATVEEIVVTPTSGAL